ncbi:MAG: hypothetical protein F4Y69_04405 [Chloroflexi bacterium]|nr:hypothetical protein [Chloroflexota bacterium]MYF21755.1 hypothetical protein [Chloroflexota bacterium]
MIAPGSFVAVIDDEQLNADTTAGVVSDASLKPVVISRDAGQFPSVSDLLEMVQSARCEAVICDHRLSTKGLAQFTGAQFVSQLYQQHIPAVLLSTFAAIDKDDSIRRYRSEIPLVMARSELAPESLIKGLEYCRDELEGHVAPERQPWRTLVRIVDVLHDVNQGVVDAVLHNWNPNSAVRFPLEVVDNPEVASALQADFSGELRVFARVNIGCRDESELFFGGFEVAPEPDVEALGT